MTQPAEAMNRLRDLLFLVAHGEHTASKDCLACLASGVITDGSLAAIDGALIERSASTAPPEALAPMNPSHTAAVKQALEALAPLLVKPSADLVDRAALLWNKDQDAFGDAKSVHPESDLATRLEVHQWACRGVDAPDLIASAFDALTASLSLPGAQAGWEARKQDALTAAAKHLVEDADRISEMLEKPHWRPNRSHTETMRNSMRVVANVITTNLPAAPAPPTGESMVTRNPAPDASVPAFSPNTRTFTVGGVALPAGAALQPRVQSWMMACFGPEISADRTERNHRFIEEALELVQACGMDRSEAHQLVDYVYGRPQGDVNQEVGGVMITLAALCLANGFDMHAAGETELARIWTKIDKIRAKQAAKPKHSPLPEAAPPTGADGDGWFSMDSAPKDGTKVDLWVVTAHKGYRVIDAYWESLCWIVRDKNSQDRGLVSGHPTNWRRPPLPPAPVRSGEGNGT